MKNLALLKKYGPSSKILYLSSRFEKITMKKPFAPSLRSVWPFGYHRCWIHLINSFSVDHAPMNLQMRAWSFMYFRYFSSLLFRITNLGFFQLLSDIFLPSPHSIWLPKPVFLYLFPIPTRGAVLARFSYYNTPIGGDNPPPAILFIVISVTGHSPIAGICLPLIVCWSLGFSSIYSSDKILYGSIS